MQLFIIQITQSSNRFVTKLRTVYKTEMKDLKKGKRWKTKIDSDTKIRHKYIKQKPKHIMEMNLQYTKSILLFSFILNNLLMYLYYF